MVKKRVKQNKSKNLIGDMVIRYLSLIIFALPNLWIFYFIFTPLTIYPVYFLLNIFFDASLSGNIITLRNCIQIEMIDACIAGSAYYLLFVLNVSVPGIKLKKRINMILLSFLVFLIVNILRIFLLSLIFITGYAWFEITHKLFWYLLSTIFVVSIWFI